MKTQIASILISGILSVLASQTAVAQSFGCQPQDNPHSYECHRDAFEGRTEFPVVAIDWAGVITGNWGATTYAVPGSNAGSGFRMDKNPANPHRPGRGVFNVFSNGAQSQTGPLQLVGDRAVFFNWQGTTMVSEPGTLFILDTTTIQFRSMDTIGFEHLFECRDFIRNNNHHLDCRWSIRARRDGPNAQFRELGYFGFIKGR